MDANIIYIGYLQLKDGDSGNNVLCPITQAGAIEGFDKAVLKICKSEKNICTLHVSGNGTNTISIPILDGFELVQVISLSGVDYICRGFCLADTVYMAELANPIDTEGTADFKCIYIKV